MKRMYWLYVLLALLWGTPALAVDLTTPSFKCMSTAAGKVCAQKAGDTVRSIPVPVATSSRAGIVKPGTGLAILPDGTLNNTGIAGVASFNGRGGSVTPQSGDYTASMIPGISTVGKTGSYLDLLNQPIIPAAQIPSDYAQSNPAAPDYIKNKPTIPSSLAQLSSDTTHRTVTDAEKTAWNSNSASVPSVFGRTGPVVAQSGDYTAVQVGADPLGSATSVQSNLDLHKGLINNPHEVTKAQVGLGNADNTSDLNKPISTATQAALDLKLSKTEAASTYATQSALALKANSSSLGTAAAKNVGTAAGDVAAGIHASIHATGGSDPITPAAIGAATAVQGGKADSALQPNGSGAGLQYPPRANDIFGVNIDSVRGYSDANGDSTGYGDAWNKTLARVDLSYETANKMGLKWVREWAQPKSISNWMQTGDGPIVLSDSDGWEALDRAVISAQRYNMKLIVTLSAPYIHTRYNTVTTLKNYLVPQATYIANRYKSYSDTIIIEPCNELPAVLMGLVDLYPLGWDNSAAYGQEFNPVWMDLQAGVYDAVKAVAPTIQVQLASWLLYSSAPNMNLAHAIDQMRTRNIGYGAGFRNSSGGKWINTFDGVVDFHMYPYKDHVFAPDYYNSTTMVTNQWDLTSTLNSTKASLTAAGRSDVTIAIGEFGIDGMTDGKSTFTNGSATVTGVGYTGYTHEYAAGNSISIIGGGTYTIASVNSDSTLTLTTNYTGTTGSYYVYNPKYAAINVAAIKWLYDLVKVDDRVSRALYWNFWGTTRSLPNPFGAYAQGGQRGVLTEDTKEFRTAGQAIVALPRTGDLIQPVGDGSKLTGITAAQVGAYPTVPGVSLNADGIDLSGATLSGSAIKLSSTQTITDGTVTKTLAQLVPSATNFTGNLPVANLNSGSGASSTTFWRGDGTWATPSVTGSSTDANAIHVNTAGEIAGLTAKATPVSGDYLIIEDSAASNAKKKITIGSLGIGSGTVTAVSSANADIAVTNGSTIPQLTLNSGAGANQIPKLNADAALVLNGSDWIAGTGTVSMSPAGSSTLVANTAGSFAGLRDGASIKLSSGVVHEVLKVSDTSTLLLNAAGNATTLTWSYKNPSLVVQSNGSDFYYLKNDAALGLKGDGVFNPKIWMHGYGANPSISGLRANGTPASPTGVTANDIMMAVAGGGYGSAGVFVNSATIQFKAGEAWGSGATGSYLAFNTTANGTGTATEKVRINGSGNVSIGNTNDTFKLDVSGTINGQLPLTVTTATSNSVESPEILSGMWLNNTATNGAAVTYNLPTAAAGKQRCYRNYTGKTGVLTLQTSAAGQYIDVDGANTASGGYVTSGGALADSACVVGVDSTHWIMLTTKGTWTAH